MAQKEENDTTSISFLEASFTLPDNLTVPKPVIPIADPAEIPPDVIDPAFLDYTITVPAKYENIFKSAKLIKMIYKISKTDNFEIKDRRSGEIHLMVGAELYHTFSFNKEIEPRVLFIFGKKEYKNRVKSQESKRYKQCVKDGQAFEDQNDIKERKDMFIQYQIDTNKNIIYVEDGDELYNQLKSMCNIIKKKSIYVPKIKTQNEEGKVDFFKSVLMSIPGVSSNVASEIVKKYKSFTELKRGLEENPLEIINMSIRNERGDNYRKIGETIFKRLHSAIVSEDKNTRICE